MSEIASDAGPSLPPRAGKRAAWAAAIAALFVCLGSAAVVPAFLKIGERRVRIARIRAIVESLGDAPVDELPEEDFRDYASDVVPAIVEKLRKEPALPNAHALADQAWKLGLLDRDQRCEILAGRFTLALELPTARTTIAQSSPQGYDVTARIVGPSDWPEELGEVTGSLVVAVDGAPSERRALPTSMVRGWGRNQSFGVAKLCPVPGTHTLEATLEARVERDGRIDAEAELSRKIDVTILPGDWRSIVATKDDAASRELARSAVDVSFGERGALEPDLRARVSPLQDRGASFPVALWISTSKPLPFWINHRLTLEVAGKELAQAGQIRIAPLLVRASPGVAHGASSSPNDAVQLDLSADGLAPGTYPLRIRLVPDPESLLWLVPDAKLDLYGGALVFDRKLIVEK